MSKLFQRALTGLMLLIPAAFAIQLSDLSPSLTRTEADENLTKDYAYRVLSDLSVRRIWNLDDNRKLTIDFDTRTGKLICIAVDYRKPVTLEEADKDAADIGKFEEAKWKKFSAEKAAKYFMGRSRNMKFKEGFMFQELTAANKCKRLSFYTSVPKENRRLISEGSTLGGVSAMGNTGSGKAVKQLLADEETRLYTANKTDKPKETPKPQKVEIEEPEPVVEDTVDEPVVEETPEVIDTPVEKKEPVKVVKKEPRKVSQLDALLAKLGLDGLTSTQWIMIGAGLLVLIVILSVIGRGNERRKLEQRAAKLRKNSTSVEASLRQSIKKSTKSPKGLRLK